MEPATHSLRDTQPVSTAVGPADGSWSACWVSGPDGGRSFAFSATSDVVVGRAAQADIRCDDPLLEPFHLRVRRDGQGWVVVQLAGRPPARITGESISVGSSTLVLTPSRRIGREWDISGDVGAEAGHASITVNRTPRTMPHWEAVPVQRRTVGPAPATPGNGGLLPATVALAGAAVIALVVGQSMFMLFGLIGAAVAIATWIGGRVTYRRRGREHRLAVTEAEAHLERSIAGQSGEWSAFQVAHSPWLHRSIGDLHGGAAYIWRRRAGHPDAFEVCLGAGDVTFEPVFADASAFDDGLINTSMPVPEQPVCLSFGPNARVALSGAEATALIRAALVELAIATGPADWQLVVVTEQPRDWEWVRTLPHIADGVGSSRILSSRELLDFSRDRSTATRTHTVVVTDLTEQLSLRTAPLRRLIETDPSIAVVSLVAAGAAVPAICRTLIATRADGRARLVADAHVGSAPISFSYVGMSARSAGDAVAALAHFRDPEDPRTAGNAVPPSVTLVELLAECHVDPFDSDSIERGWMRHAIDASPCTPIGRAADGTVDIDLVRDGPHALLAGTTGAGKSELLRSLVLGLASCVSPEQLTFVLVDYKGGATFDALTALPHVVGTVTDLDGTLADRALRSLRAELTVRERMLREHGAADLTSARLALQAPLMPRLAVVVDEFAALAVEHPGFLHALVGVAQRGRSLGVHLLLATQRPNGVIDDAIRANTTLRIALRVNDIGDALDVVGDTGPASFSRSVPGRAMMRLGPDELVTFQTASCGDDPDPAGRGEASGSVGRIVDAIRAAAEHAHIEAPRRPWLEPLPNLLAPGDTSFNDTGFNDTGFTDTGFTDTNTTDTSRGVGRNRPVGLVDVPDEQARRPLTWRPDDGHLLVAGSQGSGVTSTLLAVVDTALDHPSPPTLFVIDALGDARWDSASPHPNCAAVTRLHQRERLWRVLDRLASWTPTLGRALLVIDGIASLRHELEPFERAGEHELFERLVAEAETSGITMLIGADTVSRMPASLLARCGHRWVMHFHDAHDGSALGVPAAAMPAAIPGRVVLAGTAGHLHAQIAITNAVTNAHRQRHAVPTIGELAAIVESDTLPASALDATTWRVPIGLRFHDLAPLELEVPGGDHVLIVGPTRSGKSGALLRFIEAWSEATPGKSAGGQGQSAIVVLTPHRSTLTATCSTVAEAITAVTGHLAAGRLTLLAVDDADLVHDDSGRLSALIAARTTGLVVVASGRADALRQSYGHWTTAIRRSRIGVILAGGTDIDADLFGVALPRTLPLATRPGLAHVVAHGDLVLGQLASRPAIPPALLHTSTVERDRTGNSAVSLPSWPACSPLPPHSSARSNATTRELRLSSG